MLDSVEITVTQRHRGVLQGVSYAFTIDTKELLERGDIQYLGEMMKRLDYQLLEEAGFVMPDREWAGRILPPPSPPLREDGWTDAIYEDEDWWYCCEECDGY